MWYKYLNRKQPYLKMYRGLNLWYNPFHKKLEIKRIIPMYGQLILRMCKTPGAARHAWFGVGWVIIFYIVHFATLKKRKDLQKKKEFDEEMEAVRLKLVSLIKKNKYGYRTRVFENLELFLDYLGSNFISDTDLFISDSKVQDTLKDVMNGLDADFTEDEIRLLIRDHPPKPAAPKSIAFNPARCGTNYLPSDDQLSLYKLLPRGQKPHI